MKRTTSKATLKNSTGKQRRTRSDSVKGHQEIAVSLFAGDLPPPPHVKLRDRDIPFWNDIIATRARVLWNESDLAIAAELARVKSDIEKIRDELEKEGDVIENKKGTKVVNPKRHLLIALTGQALSISSKIQVNTEATSGKSREGRKVKEKEDEVKTKIRPALQDDLIPRRMN